MRIWLVLVFCVLCAAFPRDPKKEDTQLKNKGTNYYLDTNTWDEVSRGTWLIHFEYVQKGKLAEFVWRKLRHLNQDKLQIASVDLGSDTGKVLASRLGITEPCARLYREGQEPVALEGYKANGLDFGQIMRFLSDHGIEMPNLLERRNDYLRRIDTDNQFPGAKAVKEMFPSEVSELFKALEQTRPGTDSKAVLPSRPPPLKRADARSHVHKARQQQHQKQQQQLLQRRQQQRQQQQKALEGVGDRNNDDNDNNDNNSEEKVVLEAQNLPVVAERQGEPSENEELNAVREAAAEVIM